MSSFVLILVPAAVLGWSLVTYNQLVALRNQFQNAFAQIDVQLKRRYDLIPNLVESAKAYMAHERQTLQDVITARNSAEGARQNAADRPEDARAVRQLAQAEGAVGASLGRMLALAEAYPELKANETMSQLMEELSSTENRVGFARQAYNDAVMVYNTARQRFPGNMLASRFAFGAAELLQVVEAHERQAIRVNF
jgi:LemA protein